MKPSSRTPAVILVTLVTLTGCARERSGEVHNGVAGPDAVEVVQQDDAFVPDALRLEAGTEVEVRNEATTLTTRARWSASNDSSHASTGSTCSA